MSEPALDPRLALLRAAQDRSLASEGIPMVLALVSEVGPAPAAADPGVRAEGERLAAAADDVRAALAPGQRDGDMGCVFAVMQAVSYGDFGREEARL